MRGVFYFFQKPPLCKGRWIRPKAKDGGIVIPSDQKPADNILPYGKTIIPKKFSLPGLIILKNVI